MRHGLLVPVLASLFLACAAPRPGAAQASLPARGAADAKIVIMVFADLSSPETAKAEAALATTRKEFPADVQVLFKHNPAAERPEARLAHEAVAEAGRQGKFWEMYDLVLAHQDQLKASDLAAHAKAIGLDTAAFGKALEAHTHRAAIDRDLAEGRALGIEGPFALYINGRRAAGAPPVAALTGLIRNLVAGGDGSGPAPVTASTFDLTGAPFRGTANAPVTLVMFSDFQCGFCKRVNPTVTQLLQRYPTQIKVAFKHLPIEGHDMAPLAHRASLAANEQGKFWEMHDRIFENQRAMTRDDLIAHAKALGLDLPRFTAALDGPQVTKLIDRDKAEAEKVGIDGTPTFFVNGTPLVGAQPLEAFTAVIDKALAAAPK